MHDNSRYIANRQSLVTVTNGGVVVLSASRSMQRENDSSFKFEQEANFWYLTGIDASDWWIIIDGTRDKSWLVAPEVSEAHRIFDGSLSNEDARAISGVDAVIGRDEAEGVLRDLAKKHSLVYTLGEDPHAEYYDFVLNPAPHEMCKRLERVFKDVRDCRLELARLRAIKQPYEVSAIKKAIGLTISAFKDVRDKLPRLTYEYEIEAEFDYAFRRSGSQGHAYDPIVAAGKNACTLHYVDNRSRIKKTDLVLIDIGARYDGYAADITRTYSCGAATVRQKSIHSAVVDAQAEIIRLLKPGLDIKSYQKDVDDIMKRAIVGLGLMKNVDDESNYHRYFPHSVSHGLGINVHDSLGRATEFVPGMVLTVEPGIYIAEESIGVRIEDDILITETGYTNLSSRLSTSL